MASAAGTTTGFEAPAADLPAGLTRQGIARIDAIDMLRGLVIVIMVLDHVRDFFHYDSLHFDPVDPVKTYAALFATRWVTHLCAATFVSLAGVSIWLQKANGKPGLSGFLLKRGLWLMLLEWTVISFGFNFGEPFAFLQVMWAIGTSMCCMSLIARLPARPVLMIGIGILAVYPSVVTWTAGATGAAALLRMVTIAPGFVPGEPIFAFYAFVPWLAVMCIGFGLGPFYARPEARRRTLTLIALGLLAVFVVLRTLNGFGDPVPWTVLPEAERTVFSFMNVSKYPPSPDYVLVTLGISMLLFAALETLRGPVAAVLLTFGRTSLFSYVGHIYIAHTLMLVAVLASGFPVRVAFNTVMSQAATALGWGYSLWVVYLAWACVLVLLYPLSRWFEGVKRRRRDWWLSYL